MQASLGLVCLPVSWMEKQHLSSVQPFPISECAACLLYLSAVLVKCTAIHRAQDLCRAPRVGLNWPLAATALEQGSEEGKELSTAM